MHHHAPSAEASAAALGYRFGRLDFIKIMLSVTDAVTSDGHCVSPYTAQFVGRTRDAERWTVSMGGRVFDIIYEPAMAIVLRVVTASKAAALQTAQGSPVEPPTRLPAMVARLIELTGSEHNARTILKAMREPVPEMLFVAGEHDRETLANTWRDMIDAAQGIT